jgi:hypothetical protein
MVARLLAAATLWVRIQKYKMGDISTEGSNTAKNLQKRYQKKITED